MRKKYVKYNDDFKGVDFKKDWVSGKEMRIKNKRHFKFLPFHVNGNTTFFPRALRKLHYEFPFVLNRCMNLSLLRKWNFKGKKLRVVFYVTLLSILIDYIAMCVLINKNKVQLGNFSFERHQHKKHAIIIKSYKKYDKAQIGLRSRYSMNRKVMDMNFERDYKEGKAATKKYYNTIKEYKLIKKFRDGTIHELR